MKRKILIVDDDAERKTVYKSFFSSENFDWPEEVELLFLEKGTIAELNYVLSKHGRSLSLVIVDAVLSVGWKINIREVVTVLRQQEFSDIPVAVVSDKYDKTNSDCFDIALEHPGCRTFLIWRDIENKIVEGGQSEYALKSIIKVFTKESNLINLDSSSHSVTSVLHLSDLHMGTFDDETLASYRRNVVNKTIELFNGHRPDFIVFSGDAVDRGGIRHFPTAIKWFQNLFEDFGFKDDFKRRFLCVPGNHDISMPLFLSSGIQWSSKDTQWVYNEGACDINLKNYALAPYFDFCDALSSTCAVSSLNDVSFGTPWLELRFRHLGVIFYGVNTCGILERSQEVVPQVDARAIETIAKPLQRLSREEDLSNTVLIGVGHHRLDIADHVEAPLSPLLNFFLDSPKTSIYIHGDWHQSSIKGYPLGEEGSHTCVFSSAATLAKESTASTVLPGFNLLKLKRDGSKVSGLEGHIFSWEQGMLRKRGPTKEFVFSDGCFTQK